MKKPDSEKRASIFEHLCELRKRLIISAIAAFTGFLFAYGYSEELFVLLTAPLIPALPPGHDYMAFTSIVEPFFVYLKIGFVFGILFASPVIIYQVWAFVAPGLYRAEKIWFISIVMASLVLFLAGSLFAFTIVFPYGFKYLLGYSGQDLRPVLSIGLYFSMIVRFLLVFGLSFQLPLVILILSRLGLVTAGKLISWWRYAIVTILIASAVLTPTPDVFNQLLMAGPLAFLYMLGIIVAKVFAKERKEDRETESDLAVTKTGF